jgi:hypothetical protein
MKNDFIGAGPGLPYGYEQRRWTEGDVEFYDDIWGNIWSRMKDGCAAGEVCVPAIEDWNDLKNWQVPAFDLNNCCLNYKKTFDQQPNKFRLAGISGWVFASARYLRKMENYLMDLALYPEEVKQLNKSVAEVFKIQIEAAGIAGADAIFFCEDMGTQKGLLMSPTMWQEFFGELYKELFSMAHECGLKVMMHSCGKNDEIIEPLLRAGVNCFQFDQPDIYDYSWLKSTLDKFGAALWSPIDIQKVLPAGNKKVIYAAAERMFSTFSGSLIFKNYPDLAGIGVKEEWNKWGYNHIIELCEQV